VDETVDPLRVILETIDEDNANSVIDEAHATGFYVPGGRGMFALLGLVDCVLSRLPTLGSPRGQVVRDSLHTNICFLMDWYPSHVVNKTLFSITCAC
jgi:hypothetical protein